MEIEVRNRERNNHWRRIGKEEVSRGSSDAEYKNAALRGDFQLASRAEYERVC